MSSDNNEETRVILNDRGDYKIDRWNCVQYYNKNGGFHRLDGPARKWSDGSEEYWVDNKAHRLDGPAWDYASGSRYWYVNDQKHRIDGPAIEYPDGRKAYWVEGKEVSAAQYLELSFLVPENKAVKWRDRDGEIVEPVIYPYLKKEVYMDSEGWLHRTDGPAVIGSDDWAWCLHGNLHREDGPAIEHSDGSPEWWLNGKYLEPHSEGWIKMIGGLLIKIIDACVVAALNVSEMPSTEDSADDKYAYSAHKERER